MELLAAKFYENERVQKNYEILALQAIKIHKIKVSSKKNTMPLNIIKKIYMYII